MATATKATRRNEWTADGPDGPTTIKVERHPGWTRELNDRVCRWMVTQYVDGEEEAYEELDSLSDARQLAADWASELQSDGDEAREDAAKYEAQELLETLLDAGRASDVLRVLRALADRS